MPSGLRAAAVGLSGLMVWGLILAAPSCGGGEADPDGGAAGAGQQEPQPQQGARTPPGRGLEPWHEDFPVAVELSPPTGRWYSRTPGQIVDKVLKNLSGGYGGDAWQLALEFFVDVDDETARELGEAADRAGQNPAQADLLENILQAMERARNPLLVDPILRALDHGKESVRSYAMAALVSNATPDGVKAAWLRIEDVSLRGRIDWVKAAVATIPDEIAPYAQRLLADPRLGGIKEDIVEEVRKLPVERQLEILEPFWDAASDGTRVLIAGLRHRLGVDGGTAYLAGVLQGDDENLKKQALIAMEGGEFGDYGPFQDELLRATTSGDGEMRRIALSILSRFEGEQVDAAIETMAYREPDRSIRQFALQLLVERGRTGLLEDLLDEAEGATGTKFGNIVNDLANARYAPVVDLLAARIEDAEPADKREYLRMISFSTLGAGFDVFAKVFRGPREYYDQNVRRQDSLDFASFYMANLQGVGDRMIELFESLPRDDYVRRSLMLKTIANVAGARPDEDFVPAAEALIERTVFDREACPQLRLQALQRWKRSMRVEDVRRLAAALEEEEPAMRQALSDFLFEYF